MTLLGAVLVKLILSWSVSPRVQSSDLRGAATQPLVVTVLADEACRYIVISVDGPIFSSTQVENDGHRLRREIRSLVQGEYVVLFGCGSAEGKLLQVVNAGTVTVQ